MSAVTTRGEGSAERHEVVALAHELGRRELAPQALELDECRPGALEAAWGRVAEVGFDRALLAVDDGGVGLDAGSLLLCLEEIATGDGGVALLVLLSNAALAALPPERAAAIGETERWALVPAPPEGLATSARIEVSADGEGRPVLSGALSPAPGALGADGVVVVESGPEPAVLALAAGAPGLKIAACEPLLGLRSATPACVSLSGAAAEPACPPAEARAAADASLALLRAGAAAIARGVARRAQAMALEYAENRFQGGVPIIEHDAVREMLAAMRVREVATPAPLGAEVDGAAALAARVAATGAALATATDAVQVFGGTGYMHETGIEKLMRDAKALQLWPEPAWIAHDMIAEALRG
jgi:alkylation response protein AidB-like acyl-CoA dehydrogenase